MALQYQIPVAQVFLLCVLYKNVFKGELFSGCIIMLSTGAVDFSTLLDNMGSGVSGMFETSMVAVLVAEVQNLVNVPTLTLVNTSLTTRLRQQNIWAHYPMWTKQILVSGAGASVDITPLCL